MTTHPILRWNVCIRVLAVAAGTMLAAALCSCSAGPVNPPAQVAAAAAPAPFKLPPLPYAMDSLAPYISARTMSFHYGKHHKAYVDNLNKLVAGTPLAGQTLEEIIRESAGHADRAAVFNNAAQTWNHTFFWNSMTPGGGGKPGARLAAMIEKSFGTFEGFREAFVKAGVGQFGSGWVWLVQDGDSLKIVATANADTPLVHGQTPLLTCDVWEHAYYLDYQNRRNDFIATFVDHLANWSFAESQLK